jgi:hypothetical protein
MKRRKGSKCSQFFQFVLMSDPWLTGFSSPMQISDPARTERLSPSGTESYHQPTTSVLEWFS